VRRFERGENSIAIVFGVHGYVVGVDRLPIREGEQEGRVSGTTVIARCWNCGGTVAARMKTVKAGS